MRLGHRVPRDQRVSTHLALAARALGASKMFYSGMRDPEFEESVEKVRRNWGGNFKLEYIVDPIDFVRRVKSMGYMIIHLTMYGIPLNHILDELLKHEKFLVIVGGEKVPSQYFYISDYNVAIGSQPHSEISALAIFLDRIFQGVELDFQFSGGIFRVVNAKKGKYPINIKD